MSDGELGQTGAAGDEAALDAELAASIESVRTGKPIETQSQGQTGETGPTGPTGESSPTGETGSTGEAPTGEASATGETGEVEFRLPNKGKFESDEAYEKRVELFDLVTKRKAATTPEAKAALTAQIKAAKGELKTLGSAGRFTSPRQDGAPTGATGASGEADPELEADRERLKALGGVTREEIDAALSQRDHDAQVRTDLTRFVERHPQLKDEDAREVFFDFVEENYAWQGKSGKPLMQILEMAHENMFRPAESVQERVLKAAGVEKKVNAMQFPGGSGGKSTYSPEMKRDIDELVKTGMSEDKAAELLSE